MRRIVIPLLVISIAATAAFAYPRQAPYGGRVDRETEKKVRGSMNRLASLWAALKADSRESPIPYRRMEKSADEMRATVNRIQKANTDPQLNAPLVTLLKHIAAMRRAIERRSPEHLNRSLDQSRQLCFDCHQVHAIP